MNEISWYNDRCNIPTALTFCFVPCGWHALCSQETFSDLPSCHPPWGGAFWLLTRQWKSQTETCTGQRNENKGVLILMSFVNRTNAGIPSLMLCLCVKWWFSDLNYLYTIISSSAAKCQFFWHPWKLGFCWLFMVLDFCVLKVCGWCCNRW